MSSVRSPVNFKLTYYYCYRHFPGEDFKGKYIYEIYLDDELLEHVYDANSVEGWVRVKVFDEYGDVTPSAKKEGNIKIIKNYTW